MHHALTAGGSKYNNSSSTSDARNCSPQEQNDVPFVQNYSNKFTLRAVRSVQRHVIGL